MKKMCFFYFQLKTMIDERFFVIKNVVNNNINNFFVRNFLKFERNAINFEIEVFIETQLNDMMKENDEFLNDEKNVKKIDEFDEIDRFDEIDQFDEFENQIDSTLSRSFIQNFVFAIIFEISRSRSTITSKFIFQNAIAISARRRTNVKDVLDDFAKKLRNASTTNVDKKRIKDANIQITHRKNIQARVAMNRARLKFEKKQYKNNQRAKRRQQTITMRFRQNEIDLKREKNDLTLIQNKIAINLTNDDENIMNN